MKPILNEGASSKKVAADQLAADYLDFLISGPTSYHAADQGASLLAEVGFTEVDRASRWPEGPGAYFLVQDGALMAWVQKPKARGFAIVAAHTDSPALKLKPIPNKRTADGWGQLMVEIYGGPLNNSWLDRELLLAGAVQDWDGNRRLIRSQPIAFIPQLAPHLDRQVNTNGLVLDPQKHMQPVWTVGQSRDVMELVAQEAGFAGPEEIAASELFLVPAQEPAIFGVDNQFLMSAFQDNLSSSFAGLDALARIVANGGAADDRIPVLALFDHEEIGSGSPTGARGPLLEEVLERISWASGLDGEEHAQRLASSTLLSTDAAHSVNPAYPDKHGPETRPVMGSGPALKMDADQSYATSLTGVATWRAACRKAGIPNQVFVSHSSMRAGSTVGPLLATRLGLETVDVGIPILSMHSTRETSHVMDLFYLREALEAYWGV